MSDVADIKHGYAFKGEYFCDAPTPYLLITPGNFSIGGGFQEKYKYYNGPVPKGYILNRNDLIVTMTDLSKKGDTLGYSALVPEDNRYLHNQRIGLVNIKNKKILKEYIYWLMRTYDYQKYIVNHSTGSTVKHTSPTTILKYTFDLPSLQEQTAIVSTLSTLDDKIKNNNAINQQLELIAQTIFKNSYVYFKPSIKFTKAIQVLGGGTPKTSEAKFWNGDVPFFTPKDTLSSYVLTTEKTLTKLGLENCSSRLFPINTVFVTARGTVGKLALAGCPMAMNQSCYALIGNKGYGQFLVFHLALDTVSRLIHKASGAVFDAIVTRDFDSELIPNPPLDVIHAFEETVTPIYQTILNNMKENIQLANLRNTLLPKLLSGEIEVPVDAKNLP